MTYQRCLFDSTRPVSMGIFLPCDFFNLAVTISSQWRTCRLSSCPTISHRRVKRLFPVGLGSSQLLRSHLPVVAMTTGAPCTVKVHVLLPWECLTEEWHKVTDGPIQRRDDVTQGRHRQTAAQPYFYGLNSDLPPFVLPC